jgi:hypothetical protein
LGGLPLLVTSGFLFYARALYITVLALKHACGSGPGSTVAQAKPSNKNQQNSNSNFFISYFIDFDSQQGIFSGLHNSAQYAHVVSKKSKTNTNGRVVKKSRNPTPFEQPSQRKKAVCRSNAPEKTHWIEKEPHIPVAA